MFISSPPHSFLSCLVTPSPSLRTNYSPSLSLSLSTLLLSHSSFLFIPLLRWRHLLHLCALLLHILTFPLILGRTIFSFFAFRRLLECHTSKVGAVAWLHATIIYYNCALNFSRNSHLIQLVISPRTNKIDT